MFILFYFLDKAVGRLLSLSISGFVWKAENPTWKYIFAYKYQTNIQTFICLVKMCNKLHPLQMHCRVTFGNTLLSERDV